MNTTKKNIALDFLSTLLPENAIALTINKKAGGFNRSHYSLLLAKFFTFCLFLILLFTGCKKDIDLLPTPAASNQNDTLLKAGVPTFYVATNGSDANGNGTSTKPWASVYKASTMVNTAGSVIQILAGTYTENRKCAFAAGVSVVGAGKTLTVINTTYKGTNYSDALFCFNSGSYNTQGNQSVSKIGFNGVNETARKAIAVVLRGGVTIHDCDFINFDYMSAGFYGDAYESDRQPATWITGNKFYNNTQLNCGSMGIATEGLWFQGQNGFEVYGCTIRNLKPASTSSDCISGKTNKNVNIHDNIVERTPYAPHYWAAALEIRYTYGESRIYNNKIKGCIDIPFCYMKAGATYSWRIYNNELGWDTPRQVTIWVLTWKGIVIMLLLKIISLNTYQKVSLFQEAT